MILIDIALSVISGILYRAGGSDKGNTLYRDIGCPLINILTLGIVYRWHWSLLLCFLPLMGAYTTYRYFLPKPKDYTWYHYSLHSFMITLATILFAILTGIWIPFIVRIILRPIVTVGWYYLTRKIDWLTEGGRGFICNT